MKKHIERIENLTTPLDINNLTIEKLGNFNLFCGKVENGYNDIIPYLKGYFDIGERNCQKSPVKVFDNFLHFSHYTKLKFYIKHFFIECQMDYQIFATTQRLDVIQVFAEVAQEYKDVEAYYYRLGRSARNSTKNQSIATMYDIEDLINLTNQNIEVR
jgi:hypothetical protein